MRTEPLERELVDPGAFELTDERFREAGIALPTVAQLPDPELVPAGIREALAGAGPDDVHRLNLFRVHWHNGANRVDLVDVPGHVRAAARADRRRREDRARAGLVADGRDEASRHGDAPQVLEIAATRRKP